MLHQQGEGAYVSTYVSDGSPTPDPGEHLAPVPTAIEGVSHTVHGADDAVVAALHPEEPPASGYGYF